MPVANKSFDYINEKLTTTKQKTKKKTKTNEKYQ